MNKSIFLAIFIYIVFYFAFRLKFSTNYIGNVFSFGSLVSMIVTVVRLSVNGLNWSGNFSLFLPLEFQKFSLISFLLSLSIGLVVAYSVFKFSKDEKLVKKIILIGFWGLVFLFLPNLLYAFTERYRDIKMFSMYYLGTFYSGFASVLPLTAIIFTFLRLLIRWKMGVLGLIIIGSLTTFFAYGNLSESERIYNFYKLESIKWKFAEKISTELSASNTKNLFFPQLYNSDTPDSYNYWSYYFSEKSNTQVSILNTLKDGEYGTGKSLNIAIIWAQYEPTSRFGFYYKGDLVKKNGHQLYATHAEIIFLDTLSFNDSEKSISYLDSRENRVLTENIRYSIILPDTIDVSSIRLNTNTEHKKHENSELYLLNYLYYKVSFTPLKTIPGICKKMDNLLSRVILMKYGVTINPENIQDIWIY